MGNCVGAQGSASHRIQAVHNKSTADKSAHAMCCGHGETGKTTCSKKEACNTEASVCASAKAATTHTVSDASNVPVEVEHSNVESGSSSSYQVGQSAGISAVGSILPVVVSVVSGATDKQSTPRSSVANQVDPRSPNAQPPAGTMNIREIPAEAPSKKAEDVSPKKAEDASPKKAEEPVVAKAQPTAEASPKAAADSTDAPAAGDAAAAAGEEGEPAEQAEGAGGQGGATGGKRKKKKKGGN